MESASQAQGGSPRLRRINQSIRSLIEAGTRLITVEGPTRSGKTEIVEQLAELQYPIWHISTRGAELSDGTDLEDMEVWAQAIDSRALLVVESEDDQSVPSVPEELTELLDRYENTVLILASRSPSNIGLQTIGTTLYPATLGPDQLGYTEAEIAQVAQSRGVALPDGVVDVLRDLSGWKFAVETALDIAAKGTSEGAPERFLEDLFRQLLGLVGSRLCGQALTAAAICGFVDDDLLAHFLERPTQRVSDAVTELVQKGLLNPDLSPVNALLPGLETVARLQWSDADTRDLLRMHADFIAQGDPQRAAHIYTDLRDYADLEEVLHGRFPELLYAGLTDRTDQSLGQKIAGIPFEAACEFPLILTYQLRISTLDERIPAVDQQLLAKQIVQLLVDDEVALGSRGAVAVAATLIAARKLPDREALERFVDEAQMTLVTGGSDAWSPTLRALLLSELAASYLDLELPEEARRCAVRALEVSKGNAVQRALSALQMSLLHAYQLDAECSGASFKQAQELVKEAGVIVPDLFWQVGTIGLVVLTSLHGGAGVTEQLGEATRFLAQHLDRIDHRSHFLIAQSAYLRETEGNAAALATLESQLEATPGWNHLNESARSSLRARMANLAMYEGEYAKAASILAESKQPTDAELNSQARLQLLRGDPIGTLRSLWAGGAVYGSGATETSSALLGALALHLSGETEQAITWFDQVTQSGTIDHYAIEFSALPYEPMRELAQKARESGARDLLPAIEAIPDCRRVPYFEPLTKTELELARRTSQGGTIAEVASDLFISYNTAKSHLRRIYRKLGVNNREDAADILSRRYPL